MTQDPHAAQYHSQLVINEPILYRASNLTRKVCLPVMVVPAPTHPSCTPPPCSLRGRNFFRSRAQRGDAIPDFQGQHIVEKQLLS
jgi:hypothetical protein